MAETYKAQGIFVTGFDKKEVLAIQAQAKKDILAGRDIVSYSDQGKSVAKVRSMSVGQILAECAYALKAIDPATYGYNRNSRRVHSNFQAEFAP